MSDRIRAYSKEQYEKSGFHAKETPPIDYHKLMNILYKLNAKLPQSALERGELQRFILQLQAAVTLPEPVKY